MADWWISLDETAPTSGNPRAENVAVRGTHTGLMINPAVLPVILDRLAQPEDNWRPFTPAARLARWYPRAATWIPHPRESESAGQ
ncbi:hypothetical protein BMW24_023425 [Mycobacterium heckeshornense]|uniref:Uncharacterized protein n=1 Tax=Mycobacterium heckeshornense TaxID=110505 RepID=A0A2G8ASY3_9MYCO|nr:hypothetical protein BMW24_023425 [Mycobacterium heckeshornense]BCO36461.1 hypothetical protein MHEC_28940 [Mycobacterium heckeshornense]